LFLAYFDIFKSIPHAARIITKDDPPKEKKGRGIPVNGTNATIEAIFKNI
jgi:hypothetical protein